MSRRAGSRLFTLLTSPSSTRPISRSQSHPQFRAFTTYPPRSTQPPPQTPPPREARTNAANVSHDLSASSESQPLRDLSAGLSDPLPTIATNHASDADNGTQVDWARSFHGLSSTPFTPEQADVLQQPIPFDDIEIKPDGVIYLPEIKYRRILNKAFGPGGWGLAPRGETIVTGKLVTREYGLVCGGRLVSVARGEQQYFDPDGIPTATEGCKSNALMRCCKDLGVASELWDPRFVRRFLADSAREVMVEHAVTKKRRKYWLRKEDEVRYPFKEVSGAPSAAANGNGNGNHRTTAASSSSSSTSSMARKPSAPAAGKK